MAVITDNVSVVLGMLTVLAFIVNIIVQLTKELMPIPTKVWTIMVSFVVTVSSVYIASNCKILDFTASNFLLSLVGSFVVAYVAMYGFDTFKELWERFKNGGGGNVS